MRYVFLLAALFCFQLYGATTYDMRGLGNQSQEITVTTSATVTITVEYGVRYTIAHLNRQDDGSTASVSTDTVFLMNAYDSDGNTVTMAATHADGNKIPILAGAVGSLNSAYVPPTVPGGTTCVVQLKASGHGAKLLITRD